MGRAIAVVAKVVRRVLAVIGVLLAIVLAALYLALRPSLNRLREDREAEKRIAHSEVQLDDLELTGTTRDTFTLTGYVRNLSATYTLTDVRVRLVIEDCVGTECHAQARGYAEIARRVPPTQTAPFSTQIVSLIDMPALAPPLGRRRLTCSVYLTAAQP